MIPSWTGGLCADGSCLLVPWGFIWGLTLCRNFLSTFLWLQKTPTIFLWGPVSAENFLFKVARHHWCERGHWSHICTFLHCVNGFSYGYIFKTVTRMPSSQGRSRAFSTCMLHLMVVTMYFVTGVTAYLKPVPESPHPVDFLVSVLYSVMPPSLNPIIYSLRNKDVKTSLCKILWKVPHYKF